MKTVWEKYDAKQTKACMSFNEDYKEFLTASKTEREFTTNAITLAEKNGFKDFEKVKSKLKAGDRVYFNNRGKNVTLFVVGKKPLTEGMNVLGAHIDSPRMDLKQHPLYEKDGLALLDTHYYGGIKKYQWTARPMALHGVVCKKDGTTVNIVIGEDENDPVFGVTELLIHLSRKQLGKTGNEVVEGEQLDLTVGSIPASGKKDENDLVKKNILNILKEKYDMEEDDFMSAEIEVVPAGKSRDYGLDRSMVLGYGHDDKVCGYTSLRAILDMKKPERTSVCILTDKEEIGSVGNTGSHSRAFEYQVVKLLANQGFTSLVDVNDTFTNSRMLSSDVSAAVDPLYPGVNDEKNAAYLGRGLCFNKYTGAGGKSGSNDANAEFFAKVRRVMDDAKIQFQTCELGAVDVGGGGTIAYILADMNMDVVDAGIAVENMHAPCEIVSKADVYEAYLGYIAFLKNMD